MSNKDLEDLWEKSAADEREDPFWDETRSYFTHTGSILDQMLGSSSPETPPAPNSRRASVGERVRFVNSLESLVAYKEPPPKGVEGSVVLVRLGVGKHATEHQGNVFVRWDDGKFRAVHRRHLASVKNANRRVADSFQMFFANQGEITPAFSMTASDNELVHRSTKDLWSFRQNGEGFVLERLFNGDGHPIKDG